MTPDPERRVAMHQQTRLTLWARNDLPPKWDGRRVDWSDWDTSAVFICGPTRARQQRCEGCGSTASRATSLGTVYPLDGETFETHEPRVKRTRSGREYEAGTTTVARRARPGVRLFASRCPDCGLDTVVDRTSGHQQVWTLDESDYGDAGSVHP